MSQIMIDQIVRQQEEIEGLRRRLAHLVEPAMYLSACGLWFGANDLQSAGSSGIGAQRCKRCMAAKVREENKQC